MEWYTEASFNRIHGECARSGDVIFGSLRLEYWHVNAVLENGSEDATAWAVGQEHSAMRASLQGGDKSLGDELLRRYDDSVRSETAALELPTASEAPSYRLRGRVGSEPVGQTA